jgi:hypothetical protein
MHFKHQSRPSCHTHFSVTEVLRRLQFVSVTSQDTVTQHGISQCSAPRSVSGSQTQCFVLVPHHAPWMSGDFVCMARCSDPIRTPPVTFESAASTTYVCGPQLVGGVWKIVRGRCARCDTTESLYLWPRALQLMLGLKVLSLWFLVGQLCVPGTTLINGACERCVNGKALELTLAGIIIVSVVGGVVVLILSLVLYLWLRGWTKPIALGVTDAVSGIQDPEGEDSQGGADKDGEGAAEGDEEAKEGAPSAGGAAETKGTNVAGLALSPEEQLAEARRASVKLVASKTLHTLKDGSSGIMDKVCFTLVL